MIWTIIFTVFVTMYIATSIALMCVILEEHSIEINGIFFLFPILFFAPLIKWLWNSKLNFRSRMCRCHTCGSIHKTFNHKLMDLLAEDEDD